MSPIKTRMAMAVRSKSPHWKMRDILRRHWVALGWRHGVLDDTGRGAKNLIDEIGARTPDVIDKVRAQLPGSFPAQVADTVFAGMQDAAGRIARS
jgi:serine/threonine-protein kinase HipA